MPKVDFFTLPAFEYPVETKTFTDPRLKDDKGKPRPMPFTLHALNALQLGEMQELAIKKAYEYRQVPQDENGDPIEDTDEATPAKTLMVGGEPVVLNDHLTMQLASLVVMQCGDKADRYTFEEFTALAVNCPTAWKKIIAWRNAVIANGAKALNAEPGEVVGADAGETEAVSVGA